MKNLEKWANGLAKDNFDLNHRVRNLTRSLGFDSLREAEESQAIHYDPSPPPISHSNNPPSDPSHPVQDVNAFHQRILDVEKEAEQAREEAVRYAREVELITVDYARMTSENRALTSSLAQARSLAEEYERDKGKMREEFAERLAIKDVMIADLKKKLALSSAFLPAPSSTTRLEDKENRSPANIS